MLKNEIHTQDYDFFLTLYLECVAFQNIFY